MKLASTIGELRKSGYIIRPVKDEIRSNLIEKLERREQLFPGIIGYQDTVVPSLVNSILARHDILLLGLRGQAKSRIVRQLPSLLDEQLGRRHGQDDQPAASLGRRGRRRGGGPGRGDLARHRQQPPADVLMGLLAMLQAYVFTWMVPAF